MWYKCFMRRNLRRFRVQNNSKIINLCFKDGLKRENVLYLLSSNFWIICWCHCVGLPDFIYLQTIKYYLIPIILVLATVLFYWLFYHFSQIRCSMQLIMNLGVVMVLHWQRFPRLPKNCKQLSIYLFFRLYYFYCLFFCFCILRKFLILVLLNYCFSSILLLNVKWPWMSFGQDWAKLEKIGDMYTR